MKSTGKYCPVTEFDLDHEINDHVENAKQALKSIDESYSQSNAKAIKKAIVQTIIDSL